MTFIASVVAKDGVAIIADSLVTSTKQTIEYSKFIKFLIKKSDDSKSKDILIEPKEILELFEEKPSYTSDYNDKLFQYGKYSAITTSGSAYINKIGLGELISDCYNQGKSYRKNEKIVNHICEYFTEKVKQHLKKYDSISETILIYTNYNPRKKETTIYRINIKKSNKDNLKDDKYIFIESSRAREFEKVVCSGQNSITEGILFGKYPTIYTKIPLIAKIIFNDFEIDLGDKFDEYIKKLRNNKKIIADDIVSSLNIIKLRELSLQQAVDLASLLARVEADFQIYTEDIPTVGGQIKVATIDKNGFKYVAGHEIIAHI